MRCKKVYMYLVNDEERKAKTVALPCNLWSCPICGPKKQAQLRRELNAAIKAKAQDLMSEGRYARYCMKMLRLSVPGKEYRATHTIGEAFKDIKENWNKLRTALVKRFGDIDFVMTIEPHRDGFPHAHVLMIGRGVAPKNILGAIRSLWVEKYGMGEIDLQIIKHGINGGVGYVLKYITKNSRNSRMTDGERQRLYSVSKGLQMEKEKKKETGWKVAEIGFITYDENGKEIHTPFWQCGGESVEFRDEMLNKNLVELIDFFDGIGKPIQLPLKMEV